MSEMLDKPSSAEEEYFQRQEAERKKRWEEEREARQRAEQEQQLREQHYMKCPKCGHGLEEVSLEEVRVDRCTNCSGIWLDAGELEAVQKTSAGFFGRLAGVFRK